MAERLVCQRASVGEQIYSAALNHKSQAEPDHNGPGAAAETQKGNQTDDRSKRTEEEVGADAEDPAQGQEVEAYHKPNQGPNQVGSVQLPADDANQPDAQCLYGPDDIEGDANVVD